ncbi:putative membrane protein [Mycetocola sp. BIGb0189]|uniref:DUF981 domain-containing protein n=1 Tax=Mycetocola sp. BIGb0189 TaxID=2940604 RepID=UPI002168B9F4|nr:DUF981 domain-containing protein [Mycetocola sp. BIGb0189]MCS4277539.1 putative membrane protein [Mycetocola sp. BIGb0189]
MSPIKTEGLVIDWTQMPTYNTIMSIAAGAGLLLLVLLARELRKKDTEFVPEGWALASGVLGFILTATGLHMTLTWPFAKYFPFDNIIFGETSLGLGVLLLAASLFLWKRGKTIRDAADPAQYVAKVSRPLGIFIVGLGLALFGIAFAGVIFQLFAAPPEEPISGAFAEYPMIEAIFMSGLFALVGLGAVLFPFALKTFSTKTLPGAVEKIVGIVWGLAGIAFVLFGAMNFFTHIGLIVNTMG